MLRRAITGSWPIISEAGYLPLHLSMILSMINEISIVNQEQLKWMLMDNKRQGGKWQRKSGTKFSSPSGEEN